MPSYGNEQKGMDLALDDQHRGSVLQTLGWVLLAFDAIPAVWVWIGFRMGSYFWLYWLVVEGIVGFALLAAGVFLRKKAARDFARTEGAIVAPAGSAAAQQQQLHEPPEKAA